MALSAEKLALMECRRKNGRSGRLWLENWPPQVMMGPGGWEGRAGRVSLQSGRSFNTELIGWNLVSSQFDGYWGNTQDAHSQFACLCPHLPGPVPGCSACPRLQPLTTILSTLNRIARAVISVTSPEHNRRAAASSAVRIIPSARNILSSAFSRFGNICQCPVNAKQL